MMVPSDTDLHRMSDEELARLWARRPKYPVTAGDMEFTRVAIELRYREKFQKSRVKGRTE